MAVIGFVAHDRRDLPRALARDTTAWLAGLGHRAVMLEGEPPLAPGDPALDELEVAVSLGGDGTMLRAVDLVGPAGVPVLGVNLGHLGYLTSIEPDQLRPALTRVLAGDYRVESRMTLDVVCSGGRGTAERRWYALNDAVLSRPHGLHTVRARLYVNGTPFLTFAADSVIVATPTGSTAYNLSARGPIVSPRARVQIVTPVAAHMLFDRSLVLDASDEVTLAPVEDRPAELVVDGAPVATLVEGQQVTCRQGARDALLVSFDDRDFHHILRRKFDLDHD